jgi:hypothetical protein
MHPGNNPWRKPANTFVKLNLGSVGEIAAGTRVTSRSACLAKWDLTSSSPELGTMGW